MADEEQAAACMSCGTGWLFPRDLPDGAKDRFPLDDGVWDAPCPDCGGLIWVTEPREVCASDQDGAS